MSGPRPLNPKGDSALRSKIRFLFTKDYVGRTAGLWLQQMLPRIYSQDLLSYTYLKASKIAFFPTRIRLPNVDTTKFSFRPSTVRFVHCQPMLQLLRSFDDFSVMPYFGRSCPEERMQRVNSDHCSYSSSDQTPAPKSFSSRPRPPRVAGPDYCTWNNPSSRLRDIVVFSSFCC